MNAISIGVGTLDVILSKIESVHSTYTDSLWQQGRLLNEIDSGHLWRLRLNEDGRPKYQAFEHFLRAEVKLNVHYAYSAMALAKGYPTSRIPCEIGSTKAMLILRAPPKDREKVLAFARGGASVRSIQAMVTEARTLAGYVGESPQAKAGARRQAIRRSVKMKEQDQCIHLRKVLQLVVRRLKEGDSKSALDVAKKGLGE